MQAEVAVERQGEHVIVHARGEFDVATASTLAPAMWEAYEADCDVDLDLAETTFCDMTFLRTILDAQNHLHQAGHSMHVIHPPPMLLRMVNLLHLDQLEIA